MTESILVGAELLNWSDLHPADARPATGGPAAAALLTSVLQPTDTVLVAGPHSLELLGVVAERVASVDVLVRSAPDAEEIARAIPTGRVFCGALDRFGAEFGGYDVVVALDGLRRLSGPDTVELTWAAALESLRDRLVPGGRLLLAAENVFGFERLIQPDIGAALPRDEDWARAVAESAPAGLKATVAAIRAAGLAVPQTFSVFPSPVQAEIALAEVAGSVTGTVVARAVARRNQGPCLMDPYRVVQDAVAAGLGNELAPGWYFVIGAQELPDALPAGVMPDASGTLVEELLLEALRVDDQAALRRTLQGYVAWLLEQPEELAAAACVDNVLTDGTGYRLLTNHHPNTPSPVAGGGVEAGAARDRAEATPAGGAPGAGAVGDVAGVGEGEAGVWAGRHLERFARRALEGGARVGWPVGGDGRELTVRLAAMVGVPVPAGGAGTGELVRPLGSAEQLRTIARLAEELAAASAQARLFEGQVSGIRRSRPYRVGHAVLNPARVILRRARRLKRKLGLQRKRKLDLEQQKPGQRLARKLRKAGG